MRSPARTVRDLAAVAVLVIALLGLGACGGDSSDAKSDPGAQDVKMIDVTFDGDSVTPNGNRISVGIDQPVEFVVKADQAGEIHVHSTPEQELEYGAGTTTLTLKIDKPGLVEVESHALDKTIVQLEVK